MDEEIIGNLTTIIMWCLSFVGGAGVIEMLGGESQAVLIIGAVLGLCYSIINSYYPNTFKFLKNNGTSEAIDDPVLNEEYLYEEFDGEE